jgi:transcriptional regulator with XRE-family HTH domain
MTVSDLARALGMAQSLASEIISGTRRSPKTEERIAAFFGLPRRELFPPRTNAELEAMRLAAAGKGRAA